MTRFTPGYVQASLDSAQEALNLAHRIQVGLEDIQARHWLWRR